METVVLVLCGVLFVVAVLAVAVAGMVLTDATNEEQRRLEQSNPD